MSCGTHSQMDVKRIKKHSLFILILGMRWYYFHDDVVHWFYFWCFWCSFFSLSLFICLNILGTSQMYVIMKRRRCGAAECDDHLWYLVLLFFRIDIIGCRQSYVAIAWNLNSNKFRFVSHKLWMEDILMISIIYYRHTVFSVTSNRINQWYEMQSERTKINLIRFLHNTILCHRMSHNIVSTCHGCSFIVKLTAI